MMELPAKLAESGPFAVVTRSLEKRFGDAVALAGVDLTVPEGSVYVLVGPNGVGKSTTLKVLLDLVVADAGTAEVMGLDSREQGAAARARIGYVPERQDWVYGWMRVGDLLRYHAGYYATWDEAYARELASLFELRPEARFDRLSKGQQRRVQLVLALSHHPPLLVLDEPTDGLDPVMRDHALSTLAGHMARFPTTILISTHLVHEAERLGDHLGVMRAGTIEAQLARETLRRAVRRYHLELSAGWAGAPELADAVLSRSGGQKEASWTIWGDEVEVTERLRSSGASIRQVEPLTLEDAALALLGRQPPGARARPKAAVETASA